MSRNPAPVTPPVALTIATSDSGGGAGVQADLKTMEACGVFGTSVLCATTAQNTRGVESVHVLPTAEIAAQLDAVRSDFDIGAAKTGMLATAAVVEFVAERAGGFEFPLVVDPVMVATAGDRLLEPEGEDAYEELLAHATLVTPNADEATVLTGIEIDGEKKATEAGEALLDMGADAALVKGGHVPGERVRDVLVTEAGTTTLTHPRVDTEATHGSGCTLASAIAAHLAHGDDLDRAVERGIALLARAVRYPLDVGAGPGSVHHLVSLRERAARAETEADVAEIAATLAAQDTESPLPGGASVAGATPYAEAIGEVSVAEVSGRGGVGASSTSDGIGDRAARFLLAAREGAPEIRFVLGCRGGEGIGRAVRTLGGPVAGIEDDDTGRTTETVRRTFEAGEDESIGDGRSDDTSETPMAAVERGGNGESVAWIVASEADALVERTSRVWKALETPDGG